MHAHWLAAANLMPSIVSLLQVPLTTPVLTQVTPSDSTFKRSNFTVAVWLPSEASLAAPVSHAWQCPASGC